MEFVKECALNLVSPSVGTIVVGIIVALVVWKVWKMWKEYCIQQHNKMVDTQCSMLPSNQTIFVSIPSYRDPQCADTIHDLFSKAYCPHRITVGVCQQNVEQTDEDILHAYESLAQKGTHNNFSDRIRIVRMNAEDAKGPMYARHLIETKLFRGEMYYMVTDSHMMFTPNWDKKLIDELTLCERMSGKAVLTTYPEDFKPYHRSFPMANYDNAPGSYLRFKRFNEQYNQMELEGPQFVRKPATPILGMFWGGCLSFARSTMIQDVPFDPHCDFVFLGEELSMAARLWTHGYDLYHPREMIVYHMWERNRPTYWQLFNNNKDEAHRTRQALEAEGYKRIETLLRMRDAQSTLLPPYGLGTARTLEEYENLIGIKLRTRQIVSLSGIMGVPDRSSAADILCKFGTWKNFENAKKQLTNQITTTK